MGLMSGRTGLVVGVANERSLAWGVARALHDLKKWNWKKTIKAALRLPERS